MMHSENHREALKLAETGNYQQAMDCINRHLQTSPDDAEALNDAGAILHCLGRSAESIEHLVRAKTLRPDSAEIIWNLAEAYLDDGRADQAVQLFDRMEQQKILNPDLLNRTANVLLNQNDKAGGVEILLRSLEMSPNQEILNKMIEVIQTQRPKVAFICGLKGDTKFLNDIYEYTRYRYLAQMPEIADLDQLHEVMKTSDISWFEWCTDLVVQASRLPKVCRNIVRLHRFEAYNNWPGQVRWENIDTLILVGNSFVREALLAQVPDIEKRTHVVTIANGVNLDRFQFVDRQPGKNLACVGYLNMRKNPMFLLQCMQKLHYVDREYKLFFAGVFQDAMLEQYIRHMVQVLELQDVVFFDGWQEDINAWLRDKHYIVSASIGEGHPMGLLEAMACGLKPVIHNFPGAVENFPAEFLFDFSEQFCEQICSGPYQSQRYRRFVEENYSLKTQLGRINNIFTKLEAEIESQKTQPDFVNQL